MKGFKTIEFYLYNYKDLDNKIEKVEEKFEEYMKGRETEQLKGYFKDLTALENKMASLLKEKTIEEYKRWQVFLNEMLVFLYDNYREFYEFIVSKYYEKKSFKEIEKSTNIPVAELRKGRDLLIYFLWAAANDENLIGKEE